MQNRYPFSQKCQQPVMAQLPCRSFLKVYERMLHFLSCYPVLFEILVPYLELSTSWKLGALNFPAHSFAAENKRTQQRGWSVWRRKKRMEEGRGETPGEVAPLSDDQLIALCQA